MSNYYDPYRISTIIDDKNKFIRISLIVGGGTNKKVISFKDSNRIFSVSLDNLCQVFNVPGKVSKYNLSFNSINLFKDVALLTQLK